MGAIGYIIKLSMFLLLPATTHKTSNRSQIWPSMNTNVFITYCSTHTGQQRSGRVACREN